MLSAKIRTKWIIGCTKWIIEYFSYLALVKYRTKWIRIKWGPGVKEYCKMQKRCCQIFLFSSKSKRRHRIIWTRLVRIKMILEYPANLLCLSNDQTRFSKNNSNDIALWLTLIAFVLFCICFLLIFRNIFYLEEADAFGFM